MRFCNAPNCQSPVFSTCKISKLGYCKAHSYLKESFDNRSIVHRAMDKHKLQDKNVRLKRAVRSLPHISESEKVELDSRSNLIAELDFVFSRYIRIRDADVNGIVKCYTCPKTAHWSMMQNSHYISRRHLALRFNSMNCHTACKHCNEILGGNLEVYKQELEKEEKGLPERLEEQSREVCSMGADELTQLLIDLRSKLRIVESKLITQNMSLVLVNFIFGVSKKYSPDFE